MQIPVMTPAMLAQSVIAVPPLARDVDLRLNVAENARLIRHLESGGVTTLLYGGNAALAQVSVGEYGSLLQMLADSVAGTTTVVPSVGPGYGMMMDQARILREYPFPTVMLLPSREGTTSQGIATGVKRFVDVAERPAVLYLKHDGMVDAATVRSMHQDGLISWIKYAITRDGSTQDTFLQELVEIVGAKRIVSGMGEQPAIAHMRRYGLAGFTSGCVCIAPSLSMKMLKAIQAGEFEAAEAIRQKFAPLEKLRDTISPVRVLHTAVTLSGITDMGPITPFWSPVCDADREPIRNATLDLLELNSR